MHMLIDRITEDVRTALAKDPAATSAVTVALLYPGLHAVWGYRIAHALWERGFTFTARLLSQVVRALTGVEIHPAAEVGRRLFIDHGAAVVVGETAAIGDDVLMYHGVTLGGDSMRREKRHPTLEDGVTVGAGSVVVEAVPPETTVAGAPAEPVDGTGAERLPGECESGQP